VPQDPNSPAAVHYFLQPGYIFLARQPTLISTVLGSCVAVCLFDKKNRFGGMTQFQFPHVADEKMATPRYGNVATLSLLRMMVEEGSKLKNLEAQLFGGAHNPEVSPDNVGKDNIAAARRVLAKKRVRIVSEDVGGEKGRKLVFNTSTNEVALFKVDRLRRGDWYPYAEQR